MLLVPPSDSDVMLPSPDGVGFVPLGTVKAGVPVEVPDWAVGRSPDPRVEECCREINAATGSLLHDRRAALKEELIGLDTGSGLLAAGWSVHVEPAQGNKKEMSK
jgi:hypothetical protein